VAYDFYFLDTRTPHDDIPVKGYHSRGNDEGQMLVYFNIYFAYRLLVV
jgi:hypothetical protein